MHDDKFFVSHAVDEDAQGDLNTDDQLPRETGADSDSRERVTSDRPRPPPQKSIEWTLLRGQERAKKGGRYSLKIDLFHLEFGFEDA